MHIILPGTRILPDPGAPPGARAPRDTPALGATTAELAGGVAGVILGVVSTAAYARGHGEAVIIPAGAWADGLAAALVIGALAGLLPAIRAARLSPTQALLTV